MKCFACFRRYRVELLGAHQSGGFVSGHRFSDATETYFASPFRGRPARTCTNLPLKGPVGRGFAASLKRCPDTELVLQTRSAIRLSLMHKGQQTDRSSQ